MTGRQHRAEVLIVGAGASGVCAAIAAAEQGATVVLCEPSSWVGGMLTAAGVSAIDGNHNLPSGLWDRFRRHLYAHYGGPAAVETGWISRTLYEPEIAQGILRRMLDDAGVTVLTGHTCTAALVEGETPTVTGGQFRRSADGAIVSVRARVTVAADEFGDFAYLAGLPLHTGLEGANTSGEPAGPRKPYPVPQDLTYVATISLPGDPDTRRRAIQKGLHELETGRATDPPGLPSFPDILSEGGHSWEDFFSYAGLPGEAFMLNWPIRGNDYHGDYLGAEPRGFLEAEPTSARETKLPERRRIRQSLLDAAKEKTLRLVSELDNYFPDLHLRLRPSSYETPDGLPPIPYIREAWRIYSEPELLAPGGYLTLQHILGTGRPLESCPTRQGATRHGPASRFTRSVAVGDYPLDHHRKEDPGSPHIDFPQIPSFSVPVDVLIPRGLRGLIVAEKSIAVSGIANGCTRLQPVAMLLGEAAGVLASFTAQDPRSVPIGLLQERLLSRGCRLAPFSDVALDDPDFALLQRAGLLGILDATSESQAWENHTRLRPDAPAEDGLARRELARRRLGERKLYE